MPSGACVIGREGKRAAVWYLKFRDAAGVQVKERLGREPEWTEKTAKAELRERLVRVERKGYRKPKALTFGDYAQTWVREGETRRGWKPSTAAQYGSVVGREVDREFRPGRLVDWFGAMPLASIRPRHVAEYVAEKAGEYGAATVSRDVSLLPAIFATAKREELVETNPAERAERPKLPRRRWRILDHYRRTAYKGGDELVFCHPQRGTVYRAEAFQEALEAALRAAEVEAEGIRPFHDLRHASLTNGAAAGESPVALMARAGHRSMKTTNAYLHLAGVVFREEAERLERRLLGGSPLPEPVPEPTPPPPPPPEPEPEPEPIPPGPELPTPVPKSGTK